MGEIVNHKGDVRNLLVYQLALKISMITEIFVQRFLTRGSRTIDQMQQAARSCKQNIVEGSQAASTSKETEIKLTNVARASLGELEEDYMDYLLFHQLPLWGKNHPRIFRLRAYIKTLDFKDNYQALCRTLPAEEFCNLAITLIKQTQYLLDRLIASQEKRFLEEGGIREAMTRARLKYRNDRRDWNYRGDRKD
ncbi:MAG: four helix bundle suffix domain-containing protein [Muribaculaceae bacterium]|nr:four helix bundle suffix domain-containing protein [Muribaculaceae bacterium]